LFQKISHYFNGDLNGRRVAVWGLAFKPGTDDIREAPSLTLLSQLFEAGAIVQAYDPMAMQNVRRYFSDSAQLDLKNAKEAALEEAHVLVILTEWSEFLKPDFSAIKASLHQPIIFDGRNIYDPNTVSDYGLQYCGIGRGLTVAADYASA
ncbi:MAG: UDP-glucose/GDP-mannose dehydrogenase family protein, partial [Coxiellaceae bacterium]|nr:UDP-glucose/GDP-mannose dehydrogenase family protein [Coxiellaceae bacterium]